MDIRVPVVSFLIMAIFRLPITLILAQIAAKRHIVILRLCSYEHLGCWNVRTTQSGSKLMISI